MLIIGPIHIISWLVYDAKQFEKNINTNNLTIHIFLCPNSSVLFISSTPSLWLENYGRPHKKDIPTV